MNEVKVNVRFKTGIIYKTSTKLVTNDYNSTKLIFDFDIPDGIKIFELKDPNDKTIFVDEIKNNEIVLVAKANVTTQKDGVEYIEYTDDKNAFYWYNKESEKLYDSGFLEVDNIKLTDLTKVSKNASLFKMAGDYIFEVSLYNGDSKLTSSHDKLKVIPEQVIVDGEITETYTPVFENLISDMSEALNKIDNLDIDVTKKDDISTVTITKKDGSTKSVEIKDATINGMNSIELVAGTNITLDQEGSTLTINSTGGSGGTSNYNALTNKPKINNVELNGNKTSSDLGLQPAGNYALESEIPTKTSDLTNDSGFITSYTETDPTVPSHVKNITQANITSWNNKSDFSGNYNDLTNKPTIPSEVTETTVSNWGFTKNIGTITGITMNGASKGTSGVVDLGTVITSHQDISGKANKISVVQTSTSTIEINPNTFYKFGEVTELNLTLAEITDNTQLNEYMFEFISGATATTLTLPSSVKWLETPTIESNKIYQCSIVDNIGVLLGVSNV